MEFENLSDRYRWIETTSSFDCERRVSQLAPPSGPQEVVLDAFTFVPATTDSACTPVATDTPGPSQTDPLFVVTPNPFKEHTSIFYELETPGNVLITIFDVSGHLLRTLVQEFVPAAEQMVTWDGRDESGKELASGIYFCQLRTNEGVQTQRMVLLK